MKLEIKKSILLEQAMLRMNNEYSLCSIDKEDYGIFEEIVKRVNIYEELKTALDWLIDAVPSQDNDHDWWPDELTTAMKNAKLIQAKAENTTQGEIQK